MTSYQYVNETYQHTDQQLNRGIAGGDAGAMALNRRMTGFLTKKNWLCWDVGPGAVLCWGRGSLAPKSLVTAAVRFEGD